MENQDADILEKLSGFEDKILQFESGFKQNKTDRSLVHTLFRDAHNLKSMLAVAEHPISSSLIHAVENQFDKIRNEGFEPVNRLFDLCFNAVDLIKSHIYEGVEKEAESVSLENALNELYSSANSAVVKNDTVSGFEGDLQLHENEISYLKQAIDRGYRFYQIEKLVSSDLSEEAYCNLPVYEDIKEIGVPVITEPRYEYLDRSGSETVLNILFATDKTKEDLELYIFDPFREVSVLPAVDRGSGSDSKPRVRLQEQKKKLKILVAEDDFISRRLMTHILSNYGIVDVAVNGQEAWEAYQIAVRDNMPYDLICLDIMMPEMDGHQVLQAVRTAEMGKKMERNTAVIMTTALGDMQNVLQAFAYDADGYLVKPISVKKIDEQIEKINLRRAEFNVEINWI